MPLPRAHHQRRRTVLALAATMLLAVAGCDYVARVDIAPGGGAPNASGQDPSTNVDGRHTAFVSGATNLSAGDTNGSTDVFVRDQANGSVQRVSVADDESQGDSFSMEPSISQSGRFVAFASAATNLVAGDTNYEIDVFLRDLVLGTTTLASKGLGGPANSMSSAPSVSGDGRFVVFTSWATNLVFGDGNANADVFLYDAWTDSVELVSATAGGVSAAGLSNGADVSDDGRMVTFYSNATNLLGQATPPINQVFVRDRQSTTTRMLSRVPFGEYGNGSSHSPAISGDGAWVAFTTAASNLIYGDTSALLDVARVRTDGGTRPAGISSTPCQRGNGLSAWPTINTDGSVVAFESRASNLVPSDTNGAADVFVWTQHTCTLIRASENSGGQEGDARSFEPALSGDGRYVALATEATNLAGGGPGLKIILRFARPPDPLIAIGTNAFPRGTTAQVAFASPHFDPDVRFAVFPDHGITITDVVLADPPSLAVVTFEIAPKATIGIHHVVAANPGGGWNPGASGAGGCQGCLYVL